MKVIFGFQIASLIVVIALFGGWIANIVAIVHTLNGDVNAMFIARCVGVFAAPLGGVLGYF